MCLSPRPNLIESDEGFSVEVLGRTGILYKEGERAMIVDSEVLARAGISGVEELDPSVAGAPRKRANRRSKTRGALIENIRQAVRSKSDDIEVEG